MAKGRVLFDAAKEAAEKAVKSAPINAGAVDTSGLTRSESASKIQGMAEELANKFREHGFEVDLHHSGSAAGPSSYVKVYDPQTGRYIVDPFRISNHGKGAYQNQFVSNISDESQFKDALKQALDMRALGPSEKLKNDAIRQSALDERFQSKALKKFNSGKSLTKSEADFLKSIGKIDDVAKSLARPPRRSINAAFDPFLKNSSDILASAAPVAVGLGILGTGLSSQDAMALPMNDARGNYIGPDVGSIQKEEHPWLDATADAIDKYVTTPIPLFEHPLSGTANLLRNFGRERSAGKRYEDALGPVSDFGGIAENIGVAAVSAGRNLFANKSAPTQPPIE